MEKKIINRVNNSNLITIDLEELYPINTRSEIDIANWLENGLVLKEKDFRNLLKVFDWSIYKNHFVNIFCSTNAIIPAWSPLLVTSYISFFADKVIYGSKEDLEKVIFNDIINEIDLNNFKNKSVVIKGCFEKKIPEDSYVLLVQKLQPVVKSLFYGEACSTVPLYKNKSKV